MPRPLRFLFIVLIVVLLVGGPLWYRRVHEKRYRNFRVVQEGVLYRSGQLDLEGLKRVVRDHGIRTIISLRDGEALADQDEADWAASVFVNHVRIPPRPWAAGPDGSVPAQEGLATFRRVMDDPANLPVLIHCFAGIHRTGTYCAVFRMDYQGWRNRDAISELRTLGYVTLDGDQDVLNFLGGYVPARRQIAHAP